VADRDAIYSESRHDVADRDAIYSESRPDVADRDAIYSESRHDVADCDAIYGEPPAANRCGALVRLRSVEPKARAVLPVAHGLPDLRRARRWRGEGGAGLARPGSRALMISTKTERVDAISAPHAALHGLNAA
jgi:hypothetical protein